MESASGAVAAAILVTLHGVGDTAWNALAGSVVPAVLGAVHEGRNAAGPL